MYKFNTEDRTYATAALIVYSIYRSRSSRFNNSTKMFSYIANNINLCAKRSNTIAVFINKFSKRMSCDSISTKIFEDEDYTLTTVINESNGSDVIDILKNEHAIIMLMVRERLDEEKNNAKS